MYARWDDTLSLGFPSLDAEHKHLFEILQEMENALQSQPTPGITRALLERLIDYREDDLHAMFRGSSRCSHEQAMWLQEHRAEHNYLADRARAFIAFAGADEKEKLRDVCFFLSRWLSDHIETNQRALRSLDSGSR